MSFFTWSYMCSPSISTKLNGAPRTERQDNTRIGATLAVPIGRHQLIKAAWAKGATVRIGQDFTTVGVTYQTVSNDNGSGGKLYRGGTAITMVTVTADVLYPELAFLTFLGRSAPTLHASHQERVYGIR